MHLNEEQAARFTTTATSLLDYADDRYHLASALPPSASTYDSSVRSRILWQYVCEHPQVIDDFVRDNPDGLPQKHLDTAMTWKDALGGQFNLVGYTRGQAILLHDASPILAMGVSRDAKDFLGQGSMSLITVLVPMDNHIVFADTVTCEYVYQGVLAVRLSRELARRRSREGIAKTPKQFVERVRAYKMRKLAIDEQMRARSAEAILEQPAGYHRSPLLDLSPQGARDKARELLNEATMQDYFEVTFPDLNAAHAARTIGPVIALAHSAAILRGIMPVDELYQQYLNIVQPKNPLTEQAFRDMIFAGCDRCVFKYDLWTNEEGREYVAFENLTERGAICECMRTQLSLSQTEEEFSRRMHEEIPHLKREMADAERRRNEILAEVQTSEVTPKPIAREMMNCENLTGWLEAIPEVSRLTEFFLEHTPDGENEAFGYRLTNIIVTASICGPGQQLDVLHVPLQVGMADYCTDDARCDIMARLITNAINAVPNWKNLGWSRSEATEQYTGRRMFYNSDGTIMDLRTNDPCPCGSGRAYGQCCGHIAAA